MNFFVELFHWVWKTSVSATVLIGLAVLVLACFRKVLPAWARYGIWILVFVRLMLPVAPRATFSIWNLQERQAKPEVLVIQADPAGYKPVTRRTESLRREQVPILPVVWIGGVFVWLGIAIIKHQKLARWVRRQELCVDARITSLLDHARGAFGVRRQIDVVLNERFEVPAVFGVFRPTLLLPTNWSKEAADDELYAVLLHEMAHVKYRDALVNCVCIFLRSLHWFNPAVWYAFRRLRREREIFCDSLVLARLRPEQRSAYGGTLIKIAAQLSGAAAPTSLVPILQHKPEIHRRIHMIAKYKSTPWIISAGIALLLIVIAGLTFTRAAEKPLASPAVAPEERPKATDALQDEIARQQELVRKFQAQADELHAKLNRQSMDTIVSPGPSEVVQKMQAQQIEAQAEYERVSSLFEYLKKLSKADLKRSITTTAPDQQLMELLQQHNMAEQKMADVLENVGPEHVDVKRITRVLKQIDNQIEDRIDGIMRGLEVKRDAERARLDAMEKALAMARQHHFENVQQSRPYQEMLQQLRTQEEILQRLRMRAAEERINQVMEDSKRK